MELNFQNHLGVKDNIFRWILSAAHCYDDLSKGPFKPREVIIILE